MPEESVVVFLRAQIGEFSAKMREAGAETQAMGAKGESSFSRFQHVGSAALLGIGVAALAFGAISVKAAMEGEKAHAQLEQAIKNTGHSYKEYGRQIDEEAEKLAKFGFTHDEVETQVAKLTRVTKDAGKATELMSLAADIARARNIDLGSATDLLVKVEAHRYTALGKALGLSKETVKGIHSEREALDLLSATYGGAAAANAKTLGGKIEALKAQFHNLTEEVGQRLIPIITSIAEHTVDGIRGFQRLNDATHGWLGRIGALAVIAPLAVVAIAKIAGGVGRLVGAVGSGAKSIGSFVESVRIWMMLNPLLATGIGAVVIGAGALIAILYVLGDHQRSVTKTTNEMTEAVKQQGVTLGQVAAQKLVDWISKHDDARAAMEANGISISDLNSAIQGNGDAYHRIIAALDSYQNSLAKEPGYHLAAQQGASRLQQQLDLLRESFGQSKQQIETSNKATGELANKNLDATHSVGSLTDKTKANSDATDKNTEKKKSAKDVQAALVLSLERAKIGFDNEGHAAQKNADQVKALVQHLKDLNDLTMAAANTELRQEEAVAHVSDAQRNYAEKLIAVSKAKKGDAQAAADLRDAEFGLRHSVLDVADAAMANIEAIDKEKKAHGQNVTQIQIENDKHNAAIFALATLKQQYPGMSGVIDEYARKLGGIPRDISSNIHLTVNGVPVSLSRDNMSRNDMLQLANLPHNAAGGRAPRGQPSIVGEEGPELFIPDESGTIVPNNALRRAAAVSAAAPSVAITHNPSIVIHGGTGDPTDIERAVLAALQRNRDELVRQLVAWQRGGQKLTTYLDRAA